MKIQSKIDLNQHYRAGYPFLTLYSKIMPLKYHVFENIVENGAFAHLEQMLHFS